MNVAIPAQIGVLLGELTDRLLSAAKSGRVDDILTLNAEIGGLARQVAQSELNDIERGRLLASLRGAERAVIDVRGMTQDMARRERLADRNRPAYRAIDRKLSR